MSIMSKKNRPSHGRTSKVSAAGTDVAIVMETGKLAEEIEIDMSSSEGVLSATDAEGEQIEVPELDPELFESCLRMLGSIDHMEAVMGGIAAGRTAFGNIETYLLPGFQRSLMNEEHRYLLDSVRDNGGSVVVVAIAITSNKRGLGVPNYGVFWRDERSKSSPWFKHVVALDPDAVSQEELAAARAHQPRHSRQQRRNGVR